MLLRLPNSLARDDGLSLEVTSDVHQTAKQAMDQVCLRALMALMMRNSWAVRVVPGMFRPPRTQAQPTATTRIVRTAARRC